MSSPLDLFSSVATIHFTPLPKCSTSPYEPRMDTEPCDHNLCSFRRQPPFLFVLLLSHRFISIATALESASVNLPDTLRLQATTTKKSVIPCEERKKSPRTCSSHARLIPRCLSLQGVFARASRWRLELLSLDPCILAFWYRDLWCLERGSYA
jgi:hypothetical protein